MSLLDVALQIMALEPHLQGFAISVIGDPQRLAKLLAEERSQ
jgi:hypothetical protein